MLLYTIILWLKCNYWKSAGYTQIPNIREGNPHKNQRRNRMYWANSRRITAVQLIYADFGEREEEEEEDSLSLKKIEQPQSTFSFLFFFFCHFNNEKATSPTLWLMSIAAYTPWPVRIHLRTNVNVCARIFLTKMYYIFIGSVWLSELFEYNFGYLWQLMWILLLFIYLYIYFLLFKIWGLKMFRTCSFSIPINKNMIPTFKKLSILVKFSAFKCVPTENPIFLVYGDIKRNFKSLKNKTTQFGKFKTFSENFTSPCWVDKARAPIDQHSFTYTYLYGETFLRNLTCGVFEKWTHVPFIFIQSAIVHRMQQGTYHLNGDLTLSRALGPTGPRETNKKYVNYKINRA